MSKKCCSESSTRLSTLGFRFVALAICLMMCDHLPPWPHEQEQSSSPHAPSPNCNVNALEHCNPGFNKSTQTTHVLHIESDSDGCVPQHVVSGGIQRQRRHQMATCNPTLSLRCMLSTPRQDASVAVLHHSRPFRESHDASCESETRLLAAVRMKPNLYEQKTKPDLFLSVSRSLSD